MSDLFLTAEELTELTGFKTSAGHAKWLEKNLNELGPNARISLQGETATLSLQAAPATALARWLSQARDNAQALPTQAQLQQVSPTKTDSPELTWRGSLVLRLP